MGPIVVGAYLHKERGTGMIRSGQPSMNLSMCKQIAHHSNGLKEK